MTFPPLDEHRPEPTPVAHDNTATGHSATDARAEYVRQLCREFAKQSTPGDVVESSAQTRARRAARIRIWLPRLASATVLLAVVPQLTPAPAVVLPRDVVGVWQTTDPRYAGRQLVLTDHAVFQADSTGAISVPERITAVSAALRGDTLALAIEHQAEGAVATLNLAYVRLPAEEITLRNPAGVRWNRVLGGAVPPKGEGRPARAASSSPL
jgi:hypothetical protein